MFKRRIIILILVFIMILLTILGFRILYYKNKIKNAIIIVELKDELKTPFTSEVKVSDFITNINGEIVDDYLLDTSSLGVKEVSFEYVNEEGITIPYKYDIEVIDNTPPLVWLGSNYYVDTNFSSTLEEKIMCADDHDDEPVCEVIGDYDTKVVGKYNLEFRGTDASGNVTSIPFTLHVSKPSSSNNNSTPKKYEFSNAVERFKTDDTLLGIDVSSWQGDIDFAKVKESGVEFAFVRVGSKHGMEGEYFLDSKFEQNMKGFNDVGIPAGAYFYSYAKNEEEAIKDAEYVIEHLKGYKVDLPIAFDFEDWSRYNKYKMSLYRLNKNAEAFINTLKNSGYEGMLYGSASYINKVWKTDDKKVWVAHYTNNADYSETSSVWQFSSIGSVPGINGSVDLDVMYK